MTDFLKICNFFSLTDLLSPRSWFSTSIEVYSPFALVQLIGSSIILATCLFYLDLVWPQMFISFFCFGIFLWFRFDSTALSSHGSVRSIRFNGSNNEYVESLRVLLLRRIGHWKFWKNEQLLILRLELVRFAHQFTKVSRSDDCEHAKADLLSWIWVSYIELAHIHPSKISSRKFLTCLKSESISIWVKWWAFLFLFS